MKKLASLFALLGIAAGLVCAQDGAADIDTAISDISTKIISRLPSGARVGVDTFRSDTDELSKYISSRFEAELSRGGKFSIVERGEENVARVNAEIDYQYAGNVRDEDLVDIGEEMGVQYLVSGSFVQYGANYMSLTARVTEIKTKQALVIEQAAIASSSVLAELLGDQREPETAWDYLEQIARCRLKLRGVQRDKENAIRQDAAPVEAKYRAELAKIDRTKKPYESQAAFQNRVQADEDAINRRKDQELEDVRQRISVQFEAEIAGLESSEREWIRRMELLTFTLAENTVETVVSTYDAEAETPGWPFTITSLEKRVPFSYSGVYALQGEINEARFTAVDNARKDWALVGEIGFRLASRDDGEFDVTVVSVRLYNADTDVTLWNGAESVAVGHVTPAVQKAPAARNAGRERVNVGEEPRHEGQELVNDSPEHASEPDARSAPEGSTAPRHKEKNTPKKGTSGFARLFNTDPWPKDTITFGYAYVGNEYFSANGMYAGFFCTPAGKYVYFDWLNVVLSGDFVAASVDAGVHLSFWRFHPFFRLGGGAYYSDGSSAKQYYYRDSYSNGKRLDESGFMVKLGIGTDFRLSEQWKLSLGYDMYVLTGNDARVADGFKLGASFGRPATK